MNEEPIPGMFGLMVSGLMRKPVNLARRRKRDLRTKNRMSREIKRRLIEGQPYTQICKELRVSPNRVSRVKKQMR